MGYLNTKSASERINAAFKQRETVSMGEIIESIMMDPESLEEAKRHNGSDGSLEGAQHQTELKVECIFSDLFNNELIEPVLEEDFLWVLDYLNEIELYWEFGGSEVFDRLHRIAYKANSTQLPVIEGFDL